MAEQYFYKVPKIVEAIQLDMNDYQSMIHILLMCGHNANIEEMKQYIDTNKFVHDGEAYFTVQNFHDDSSHVKLGCKHEDYVVKYANMYSGTIVVEVIDKLIFNQYCKKMSDIVKADTV